MVLIPTLYHLSLRGTRVWLRQPEHKLDDPGNPVSPALEKMI
jgi:hypothetical protein